MEQKIYPIDEYRARFEQKRKALSCCCDARRIAEDVVAKELDGLRRTVRRPNVLCLENLDHGVPSIAGGWDLIYSTGLLTGLPWVAARQILRTTLFRLKPGGRLIFANVQADAHLIRCAACRRNSMSGRTESQIIELAAGLRPDVVAAQLVYSDGCGMNTFLELHKDTAGLPQSTEHVTDGAFLERAIRSAV